VRRAERSLAAQVARTADRVEILQSLDLFTGASRPVLERLASSAQPITCEAGTVLLRQGDPADALLVLTEGRLLVDVVNDGRVQHRPDVSAPDYVGEIGLLRGIPRTATVSAATDSQLLRIEAADFRAALDTASASRTMMSVAAERFARADPATTST
jgi:CRP-like cAMP-binding protein